jgi:hypothetical protein
VGHVLVSLTTAPAGSADDIWPTDAEYECGLSGLERAAPGVREWEAFNEPDSNYAAASTETDCTSRNGVWVVSSGGHQCQLAEGHSAGGNGHGGSAQAAAYWYLDAKRVDSSASRTLLAGGFNYSSSRCTPTTCYYLAGYFRNLSAIYPHPPDAIALNPYIDVSYAALNGSNPVPPSSSGLPSAVGAIAAIDRVYPSNPPIWFTEVGVWLTDGGREPVTSGCADGNPQDIGTWAACLNGNPTAQALAAEGYLRLPEESPQPAAARLAWIRRAANHLVRALRLLSRRHAGRRHGRRIAPRVELRSRPARQRAHRRRRLSERPADVRDSRPGLARRGRPGSDAHRGRAGQGTRLHTQGVSMIAASGVATWKLKLSSRYRRTTSPSWLS